MENQTMVKEICPTTTQKWIENGAWLIDVREKDEVNDLAFDVVNCINIPLSAFEERFHEVPKEQEVVMVCRSGGKSLRAAGFLINNGHDANKVVNMQHGMMRWAQKGFPTNGDTDALEKDAGDCCSTTNCC